MKSDPITGRLDTRQLVFPLLIELSLGMFVGMVGTTLASRVSDAAGGGFALANHLFGLLFMIFRLVGAGISVVITQNLGAGHRAEADRVARAALASGTWMGGLAALLAAAGAMPLLKLLNAPHDVLVLAAPFLQCLALALLLVVVLPQPCMLRAEHIYMPSPAAMKNGLQLLNRNAFTPRMTICWQTKR